MKYEYSTKSLSSPAFIPESHYRNCATGRSSDLRFFKKCLPVLKTVAGVFLKFYGGKKLSSKALTAAGTVPDFHRIPFSFRFDLKLKYLLRSQR